MLLFAPLISFIARAVLVFSARAGYGKVCSCGRERTHGRGGYPGFPAPLKAASYIGRWVTIIDATALKERTKKKVKGLITVFLSWFVSARGAAVASDAVRRISAFVSGGSGAFLG